MTVFNPNILDASLRDIAARLPVEQKADVLLYALEKVPPNASRAKITIENAAQSCLQVANLPSESVAKCHLLRAKVRMANGQPGGAEQDLRTVLSIEPENMEAQALLTRRSMHLEKSSKVTMNPNPGSPSFSVEVWREIASFLPRRDLMSLLWVPHALSRIASQLLFRKVDLYFSAFTPQEDDMEDDAFSNSGTNDRYSETPHTQRSATILTRMIVDPPFAGLIRTLRIHAVTPDNSSIAFQTGMLASALPHLINLKRLHCAANYEDMVYILRLVHKSQPQLQALSISIYRFPEGALDLELPNFRNLKHFAYSGTQQQTQQINTLLALNSDTLKRISLQNKQVAFPSDHVSLRHLTHLHFEGSIPQESQMIGELLLGGEQLEFLSIHCVLKCYDASAQIRANPRALPSLRHFELAVGSIHRLVNDQDLFPAIAEFLRDRQQLTGLRLTVCDSETVQRAIGFEAAAWSVLTSLPNLKSVVMTWPKNLPPGLAAWLIPRGVVALGLESLKFPNREAANFLNQIRNGIPPDLRAISLKSLYTSTVREIVDEGFPSVRLVRVGESYWTVTRTNGRHEFEQWPKRRVEYHLLEWLEGLGCEELRPPHFVGFE